jgi:hypothetical protein
MLSSNQGESSELTKNTLQFKVPKPLDNHSSQKRSRQQAGCPDHARQGNCARVTAVGTENAGLVRFQYVDCFFALRM